MTRDPEALRVCRTIEKVAPASATVLIQGESGTGKELLARALHDLSPRRDQRFVAINCAAIPETLLETELFGYEKGAYTGAAKRTFGKFEIASGGTLFLDEVGDLPLALQAKLLRFLQERVIERIGGREEIAVDVRIVCATHQSLKDHIVVRALPRGSVLPDRRNRRRDSAAARPQGRRGAAGAQLRAPVRRRAAARRDDAAAGRDRGDRGACLAGQRARARERDQARRHHGRRLTIGAADVGLGARRRGAGDPQPAPRARGGREGRGPARARTGQRQLQQGGRAARREPSHTLRSDAPLRPEIDSAHRTIDSAKEATTMKPRHRLCTALALIVACTLAGCGKNDPDGADRIGEVLSGEERIRRRHHPAQERAADRARQCRGAIPVRQVPARHRPSRGGRDRNPQGDRPQISRRRNVSAARARAGRPGRVRARWSRSSPIASSATRRRRRACRPTWPPPIWRSAMRRRRTRRSRQRLPRCQATRAR